MFLYFKKLNVSVVCIQETHCQPDVQHIWSAEWGGKMLFSNGKDNSCEVAILFNLNVQVEIEKISGDNDGRLLMADCCVNQQQVLIVNAYAPNLDSPVFFMRMFETISTHKYGDRVLCGDLNLVLDVGKDSMNRKNNNIKSKNLLDAYMEQANIIDAWRYLNPKQFQFTWNRKRPNEVFARLDYILITQGLLAQIKTAKILPAYKTDHSFPIIELETLKNLKRGRGLWKLNASILEDLASVVRINKKIEKAKEIVKHNDACTQWEFLKQTCINECQIVSAEKAKELNRDFKNTMDAIEKVQKKLESKLLSNIEREICEEEFEHCNSKLQQHLERRARGARIRSRTKWYLEGESSTKYFLGLERVKYQNKTIKMLRCEDNSITRDQKKILQEQSKFYKKLYSKNPEISFVFQNKVGIQLTTEQKLDTEEPFSFEEFTAALKAMASSKTPGCDGLTKEFYVVFWSKIGHVVWNAMLESHKK